MTDEIKGDEEPDASGGESFPLLRPGPHETQKVVKRAYTLSDKALAARRANAQHSTGPTSPEGKASSARNGWKHGLYAATTALGMIGKPCVSTCPKYPCNLVEENETHPGSECLDKEFFLDALQKIQLAIQEKRLDGVNEIIGTTLAQTLSVVNDLQQRLLSEGTVLKNAKMDKDGRLIGWEQVLNPALVALPKLLASLGISFESSLLTPASIAKHQADDKDKDNQNAMGLMADATLTLSRALEAAGKKEK